MEIVGKLKNGAWLVKHKRNEIAKLNGLDYDNQMNPQIEVGQRYPISNRWNLLKMLRIRKKKLKSIGTEITNISDAI